MLPMAMALSSSGRMTKSQGKGQFWDFLQCIITRSLQITSCSNRTGHSVAAWGRAMCDLRLPCFLCVQTRLLLIPCASCVNEPSTLCITESSRYWSFVAIFGSRPSDHYFRSVCLFVCLFVCAEFFSAVFDPISIKLGHMLYVWV